VAFPADFLYGIIPAPLCQLEDMSEIKVSRERERRERESESAYGI
jgi:hypothetical protein